MSSTLPSLPGNLATIFAAHEATRNMHPRDGTLPHALGVVFMALSVLIMAYSSHVAVWPIVIFFALWFSAPMMRGAALLRPSIAMCLPLWMPVLCILSTLWSDYPSKTLYLGTAFFMLTLCAVIMARSLRFHTLIEGLILGAAITLLLSVLNGQRLNDNHGNAGALIGLFGSKNQLGFIAEIGIIAALARLITPAGILRRLIIGFIPLLGFAYCLALSQSATAILSLALVFGCIAFLTPAFRAAGLLRTLMLLLCVAATLAVIVLFININSSDLILGLTGKDPTLTGRTYLWQEGLRIGMERPFGRGYSAFWVHGQPLAERYWQEFYITARTGFHFHQTFIQVLVDLGVLGAVSIALVMVFTLVSAFRSCLKTRGSPEILFMLALAILFFVRAWMEVDIFTGPFGIGAFLFYAILPRLSAARG